MRWCPALILHKSALLQHLLDVSKRQLQHVMLRAPQHPVRTAWLGAPAVNPRCRCSVCLGYIGAERLIDVASRFCMFWWSQDQGGIITSWWAIPLCS